MRNRVRALVVTLAGAITAPGAAQACSVCFSATDAARGAYYATTAFMILLPIGLAASIGIWLYRTTRRASDTPTP